MFSGTWRPKEQDLRPGQRGAASPQGLLSHSTAISAALPRAARTGVVALAVVVTGAGCATVPRVPSAQIDPLPSSPAAVVFRAGDVVEVKFRYWPDLNEVQTIRPDGMISLQLVHEVEAAGKQPEELRHTLLDLYSNKLKEPEITVIARVEENRMVHVGGEVNVTRNSDGLVAIPILGRLTVMEAIIQAGGLRERSASISNVLIIRRFGEKQYARTIDLRSVFREPEGVPFYLEPNDIVYVPRTKIDRMNQWVDQFLNQPVPDWINLNVNLGDVRSGN